MGNRVFNLNELEYVRGEIWSNIWHSSNIVRINPDTGVVSLKVLMLCLCSCVCLHNFNFVILSLRLALKSRFLSQAWFQVIGYINFEGLHTASSEDVLNGIAWDSQRYCVLIVTECNVLLIWCTKHTASLTQRLYYLSIGPGWLSQVSFFLWTSTQQTHSCMFGNKCNTFMYCL
jgi:hypothetical protein